APLAAPFSKTADDAPAASKRKATPPSATPPATTPSARKREPVPEQPAAAEAPSPQERLRQAFSADIPHSLLDPPARQESAAPAVDPFARPHRAPESFIPSPSFGRPVIRVVGVGGAGVNAVNRMV